MLASQLNFFFFYLNENFAVYGLMALNIDQFLIFFLFFFLDEPMLNYPDDDEKLKVFLRPCKYYPQSALQRVSVAIGQAQMKAQIFRSQLRFQAREILKISNLQFF